MPADFIDPDRVLERTFVAHVETHAELASTNDRALELASDPHVPLPCLVIADRQGRGRGRGGNLWWSSAGALTFSLLLDAGCLILDGGWRMTRKHPASRIKHQASPHLAIPPSRYPEVSLTVGSSVCAALARRLPQEGVRLKWPNDVYLRGRKVCGVLIECGMRNAECGMTSTPHSEFRVPNSPRLVIGIGVNVNNSAEQAPVELRQKAIALCDAAATGCWMLDAGCSPMIRHPESSIQNQASSISPQDVLIDILQEFARQLADLLSHPERTRALWRRYDLLAGKSVTLDDGHAVVSGTSLGIDDDGALLLATPAGTRRCYAGVVQSFT